MLVRFITKATGQKSLENSPITPVEEQKLVRGRVFVRSIRREVFCERGILKNFTMFRKTAVLEYVLIKLHAFRPSFPMNIVKIFKTPILHKICERLLLELVRGRVLMILVRRSLVRHLRRL